MFQTLWDLDIQIPEPFTTLEILVPVLLVFAPHLSDELLPGLLRGDDTWAQAFSEPDAGSDLASLRTRMEPDGDGFRLYGQKVWSTFGHLSRTVGAARPLRRARAQGAHDGARRPRPGRRRRAPDPRRGRREPLLRDLPRRRLRPARAGDRRARPGLGGGDVHAPVGAWRVGLAAAGAVPQATRTDARASAGTRRPSRGLDRARLHADGGTASAHPRHRPPARPRGDARPGGVGRQAAPHRRRDGDVEHDPRARRCRASTSTPICTGCAASTCSAGRRRSTAARRRSNARSSPSGCSGCRATRT